MSNKKSAERADVSPLRIAQGIIAARPITGDDLSGYLKTVKFARQNGIDLQLRVQEGSVGVDFSNTAISAEVLTPTLNKALPRFVNLDANCKPVAIGKEHVAVYDRLQDLIFTASKLPGEANHADSLKKCTDYRLFGRADWRAQTAHERFGITDLKRRDPAINTDHFKKESGWEWTADLLVNSDGSPSDYAWCVYLGGGGVFCGGRSSRGGVRAVAAGQQLALSL